MANIRFDPTGTGGTESLPLTHGSLSEFQRDQLKSLRWLYHQHGPIAALEDQGQRFVFAFDPEYNQQIFTDTQTFHSHFFASRGPKNSAQRRVTQTLLSMNGEEHKYHRRLVMTPFQKPAIESYHNALVVHAQRLVDGWQPGQVLDISREMNNYMLRVTSSILFGYDNPELAYSVARISERWVAMNHEVGLGCFVSDPHITASYQHLLNLAEEMEAKVREMIAYRRATSSLGRDVLSLLLRAYDAGAITDAELIGQAGILFAAAYMTTSHSLTWAMFLLAQFPDVAANLVNTLHGLLHGAAPTMEQLDRLPLLDWILKESMRILPASAYSQRLTAEPVQLGPFHLGRGVPIVFSQLITHHMPDLFPDPESFRPSRWQTLAPSPYAYFPFATGPRMCLGTSMAMVTLKITLSIILQRWRLEVIPGATINARVTATMLGPADGMPMVVRELTAPFSSSSVNGNIHDLVTLGSPPPTTGCRNDHD